HHPDMADIEGRRRQGPAALQALAGLRGGELRGQLPGGRRIGVRPRSGARSLGLGKIHGLHILREERLVTGNIMSTNQLDKKSQAWSALFSEPMSELVKRYTASVFFDKRLWKADIQGSLAHADMLQAQGL